MYKILSFIGFGQTLASRSFESGISDAETKIEVYLYFVLVEKIKEL